MSKYIFNAKHRPRYYPPVVRYNGADIMSNENISSIIGKKKSRKTLLLLDIVRAAITGHSSLGFDVKTCPKNKKVYFFDTEMAKIDFYNRLDGLFKGETPENLVAVNISDMSHKQRRNEIINVRDAHIIFIDGVADLIIDFNDIHESREVVALIKRVAINNSCPVAVVQHLNPGDPDFVDKGRGNLGTEIANKQVAAILVKAKGDVSEAKFRDVRNSLMFDKFVFSQDSKNFVSLNTKDNATLEKEVVNNLQTGKVYTLKEIAEILGVLPDRANKVLRKINSVEKISRGKYKKKNS